jgi:hypothetical protein
LYALTGGTNEPGTLPVIARRTISRRIHSFSVRQHRSASRSSFRMNSDVRSEEENMSSIALSHKAQKLMKLCDIEGFENVEAILFSSITDTVCPAICMTEGCDHTAELEPDSREGYCEACGGNTMISALVLAGVM